MSSGKSQTHILESGCTYWVDTDDGQRHRLDLSSPGEIWLLSSTSADVTGARAADWVPVLVERVIVSRGDPMILLIGGGQVAPTRWTSANVTGLRRSSKTALPAPVEWDTEPF